VNASYREHCHMLITHEQPTRAGGLMSGMRGQPPNRSPFPTVNGSLWFFPPDKVVPGGWYSLETLREQHGNAEIDSQILDLLTTTPKSFFPGASADMWVKFQDYFTRIWGLFWYMPVFQDFYQNLFTRLALEDNVQYVEFRGLANGKIYDFDRTYSEEEALLEIRAQSRAAALKMPCENAPASGACFVGSAMIYAPFRGSSPSQMQAFLEQAIKLRAKYPETLAGFDLVGQEDPGFTLLHHAPLLLEAQQNASTQHNMSFPFFFHAGETSWGMSTPVSKGAAGNLYDAAMLGDRIGHGLALPKLPALVRAMGSDDSKKCATKDLTNDLTITAKAVEVCPISNQVLQYVQDMRDHPATDMLAAGVPITISPDDPAPLGYGTVAFDWFQAYVSWELDLRGLKQIALNSIKYSSLPQEGKNGLLVSFSKAWSAFIQAQDA